MFDRKRKTLILEIVTDKELNLKPNKRVRELVVPESYKTSSGALYKVLTISINTFNLYYI